jgi:YD repeat-containing protein
VPEIVVSIVWRSKVMLESKKSETACTYTNATATTTAVDWDSLRKIIAEFRVKQQEELRDWSRIIEQTTCNICGRKPTLTNGNTLVVCPHLYEAVKRKSELQHSELPAINPLLGISIVVFDDGPVRW